MDEDEMRRRVSRARVARLATLLAGSGAPHQVPICLALLGDTAYSVIDNKPKTTLGLRRLDNVRDDPRAGLLIDHYADDWSSLWWIRLDTRAREVTAFDERGRAISELRAKYSQYREQPLSGTVLAFDIVGWHAWEAIPS